MALIDKLAMFSSPAIVADNWSVRLDTHFLGGRRHYHSWEIADIGVVVSVRLGGRLTAQKIALLQSKRLFPSAGGTVAPDVIDDYWIGFGRLLASQDAIVPQSAPTTFRFTPSSKYESLAAGDDQARAIAEFQRAQDIPVHYLLYNPWDVPVAFDIPLIGKPRLAGRGTAATRVVRATDVATQLQGKAATYTPTFRDLRTLYGGTPHAGGWRLDYFVGELLLKCREGKLLIPDDRATFLNVFSRRSGPISAAFGIAIEGPAE